MQYVLCEVGAEILSVADMGFMSRMINVMSTRIYVYILSRIWVTIDGVWIGNWIYWTFTERNYK
jgi:hypothetical protein